jgi:uncharacterized membrane protein YkvA (DUF1232 family)
MRQQTNGHRIYLTDPVGTIERTRLSLRLLQDPRVPSWTKAALPIVAALYLFLPIDLIPDFLLGLGQVDDLSVLGITLFVMTRLLPKLAPEYVVDEHLSDLRGGRRGSSRSKRQQATVVDAAYTVVNEATNERQRGNDGVWGNQA